MKTEKKISLRTGGPRRTAFSHFVPLATFHYAVQYGDTFQQFAITSREKISIFYTILDKILHQVPLRRDGIIDAYLAKDRTKFMEIESDFASFAFERRSGMSNAAHYPERWDSNNRNDSIL